MFSNNKNMQKNVEADTSSINIIGAGTQITGELNSGGDIRIDGKIKGNITVKGKLVVGPTGVIDGDINCKNADVSGKVDGKIIVNELLSIKASAKIHGEVTTGKLVIEAGAIFTGSCQMDTVNNTVSAEQPKK